MNTLEEAFKAISVLKNQNNYLQEELSVVKNLLNLELNQRKEAAAAAEAGDKFKHYTKVLKKVLWHMHAVEKWSDMASFDGYLLVKKMKEIDPAIDFGKGRGWTSPARQWLDGKLLVTSTENEYKMGSHFHIGPAAKVGP